jgi:ABC-type antimicrobial peptide transport system permease subunit
MSRSLVTVSSVVLAVAFLLVVIGGELGTRAVHGKWASEMEPAHDAGRIRRVLNQARSSLTLVDLLAKDQAGLRQWADGLGIAVPAVAEDLPARALVLSDWIADLKPSQRYLVVRNQTLGPWLLGFDEAEESAALADIGATFKGTRLPMPPEELATLAGEIPSLAAAVTALQEAEVARLKQVATAGGTSKVLAGISDGLPMNELTDQGLPLAQVIDGIADDRYTALREQLQIDGLRAQAQAVLSTPRMVTNEEGESYLAPALGLGVLVDDAELQAHPLTDEINAAINEAIGADGRERISAQISRRRTLDGLRETFTSLNFDPEAGSSRTIWLVLLSLMVCIVGIVNSMMMAVTERFREIATMKCLGAVDGFILKAFLIESGSVGLVGAFVGAVIGIILVLLQSTARFGGTFWAALPAGNLFVATAAALLCGLILTILGALLPAYRAARMHPIEAMRLEA